jgi:hypothetical protein
MHYNIIKNKLNSRSRLTDENNNFNNTDNILNHKYPSLINNMNEYNNKKTYYEVLHNDINEKMSNINYLIDSNKKENKIKEWNDYDSFRNQNYLEKNEYSNRESEVNNNINHYDKQNQIDFNSSRKSDKENYNKYNNTNYLNKFINNDLMKNNFEYKNDENQQTNLSLKNSNNNLLKFSNLDEVKNNKNGIKLNLEEEIFLQFLLDFIKLSKETESLKNELARKKDFSIIKLFKIFQSAEEESNKMMNYERNNLTRNFNETINILKEKNNYPNTFNKTQRYCIEDNKKIIKKYIDENINNINKNMQELIYQSFPPNLKNENQYQNNFKQNKITKFSFKMILNDMGIYPTLLEMKLIFNRFNNKFPDFR